MTEQEKVVWKLVHNWCDQQANPIPDANRRALMDGIIVLFHKEQTTLEKVNDEHSECYVTSCCKAGPMLDETYCPRCGKQIINNIQGDGCTEHNTK